MHFEEIPTVFLHYEDMQQCVEGQIILFLTEICDAQEDFNIVLVSSSRIVSESDGNIPFKVVKETALPTIVKMCSLPCIYHQRFNICWVGLCTILRKLVQFLLDSAPCSKKFHGLLGFRGSSLKTCAEVSMISQFCEKDAPGMGNFALKSILKDTKVYLEIPEALKTLDLHLGTPLIAYPGRSIYRVPPDSSKQKDPAPFIEGQAATLCDVIAYYCVKSFVDTIIQNDAENLLKTYFHVAKWLNVVENKLDFQKAYQAVQRTCSLKASNKILLDMLSCDRESGQKLLSTRKCHVATKRIRQDNVDEAFQKVLNLDDVSSENIYKAPMKHSCGPVDWEHLPDNVHPGVHLPADRSTRKCHQLENLLQAICALTETGDRVVDFCSGGGHLGILVAHHRPDCHVILLENKAESMVRAVERVQELNLTNVSFIQGNMSHFKGDFQVGTSLHACGTASDLVIEHCLTRRAAFVVCPCCYGSIRGIPDMGINYPRYNSTLTYNDWVLIGHVADQTEFASFKAYQGRRAMRLVDNDRLEYAQKVHGYHVQLSVLEPSDCSPKNHCLVGTVIRDT